MKKSKKKKIAIIIIVALTCIIVAALASFPIFIMKDIINKHFDVTYVSPDKYSVNPASLILKTEDGLSITAWEVEKENPKGIVILLSGIQNPSVTAFWGYSKLLQDNGYASLLIEMRAHGYSEGNSVGLGMTEYLDVKAGVNYIKGLSKYTNTPIIVWGTSMGGTTAINATGEIDDIDGLISCSAYSSWNDVLCDSMKKMGIPSFIVTMDKPFINLYLGFVYGFEKLDINPSKEIAKLNGRPTLLMHSTEDSQVPYASFERLVKKAGNGVETFIRKGDNHFICYDKYFDNPAQDKEFSSAVLNFLNSNFK